MKNINSIPAELWSGNRTIVNNEVENYLRTLFCQESKQPGCSCHKCSKIKEHQHPSINWLCPEKQYTVSDIEQILHTTSFSLEEDQHFFFVLDKAETLTDACANKLLKTLEEPPPRYHFILITTNRDAIIPTIRSRCILKTIANNLEDEIHPLLKHFKTTSLDPFNFEKDLKDAALTEHDTSIVIDSLLALFCKQRIAEKNSSYCEDVISYLETAIKRLPQPGSSTLFWKNLYLNFPRTSS